MTFPHCATRVEQRANSVGLVPDTNTDREMNGQTTFVKSTPLEERSIHSVKNAKENLKIGGRGGEESA